MEEWKKTVIKSLKGADYDKVMHSKTYEGITLEPIYRYENIKDLPFTGAMPGAAPFHRGNDPQRKLMEGWKVAQAHSNPDPKALNKELLEALSRGLSMVNLHLKHSDRTDGVSINNVEDFTIILHGIDLKAAPSSSRQTLVILISLPCWKSIAARMASNSKRWKVPSVVIPPGSLPAKALPPCPWMIYGRKYWATSKQERKKRPKCPR